LRQFQSLGQGILNVDFSIGAAFCGGRFSNMNDRIDLHRLATLQRWLPFSTASKFDTVVAMTQVHPHCDASGAHGVR
jgi:hypothetical protein